MAKIPIIFTFLVVITLVETGLATNYGYYDQEEQKHPKPSPLPPPESAPTEPNPNTCREQGQVCRTYDAYTCCKGLWCVADVNANLPGGIGACLPLNPPPSPPPEKCQKINQFCQTYGPATCCEGLRCIHPRTVPPTAGLNPEKMKPPPGFGLCTTI